MPIAGLSLLMPLFHLPIVLLPAHIAFLELIIDPACSTVFEAEPEDNDVMNRPPRPLKQRLFDTRLLGISVAQGLGILIAVVALLLYVIHDGASEEEARTMAFTALVLADLLLIITNLSWRKNIFEIITRKNTALWSVLFGTCTAIFVVLYQPVLRSLFHFSILHANDVVLTGIMAIASVAWFEILKSFTRIGELQ